MRRHGAILSLLIAGCGNRSEITAISTSINATAAAGVATATNTTTVTDAVAPKSLAGAGGDPLAPYVGKYPFDAVGGVSFYQVPAVRAAVNGAVRDPQIRLLILDARGPTTPIARGPDGRLIAWGCEAHNCGPHNWSLVVGPDGGNAEVCYHDDGRPGATTRWFRDGAEEPGRTEECQAT